MRKVLLLSICFSFLLLCIGCEAGGGKIQLRLKNSSSYNLDAVHVNEVGWTNVARATTTTYKEIQPGNFTVQVTIGSQTVTLGSGSFTAGGSMDVSKFTLDIGDSSTTLTKD
jgi:hypothetical protein